MPPSHPSLTAIARPGVRRCRGPPLVRGRGGGGAAGGARRGNGTGPAGRWTHINPWVLHPRETSQWRSFLSEIDGRSCIFTGMSPWTAARLVTVRCWTTTAGGTGTTPAATSTTTTASTAAEPPETSSVAAATPFDDCVAFIVTAGGGAYDAALARGMARALQEAGLSGDALLATARQLAGRYEVGEDQGLAALAATVRADLARSQGRAMVRVWVVPPSAWASQEVDEAHRDAFARLGAADMARAFPVMAVEGTTLADVARFGVGDGAATLGEYMECACSGIMACSTCHVVVEPGEWYDKVGSPSEAEQDMLDLAYGPRQTSRLGCQIVLTKDLDGMVVRLPAGANNIMDDIPFKD